MELSFEWKCRVDRSTCTTSDVAQERRAVPVERHLVMIALDRI